MRPPETEEEIAVSQPILAIDTMPWWGRVLAWICWRLPLVWFVPLISAGAIGVFYGIVEAHEKSRWVGGWMLAAPLVLVLTLTLLRRFQPDPYRFAVRAFDESMLDD